MATAITEDKPAVTHKQGQRQEMLTIENLLHFEPYACLNRSILSKLFGNDNDQDSLASPCHGNFGPAKKVVTRMYTSLLSLNECDTHSDIVIIVYATGNVSGIKLTSLVSTVKL